MEKRVGFIGLGQMGKPMAANLLKAGYEVSITYHRNKDPAEELQAQGALLMDSVKAIAEHVDIVITILPQDEQIYDVYMKKDGLLSVLSAGSTCIEMTSARPDTMQAIEQHARKKKIRVLDAPVSGGISAAEDGSLTIMAGGETEVLEDCRALLETMGKNIFYTGEIGSGKAMKMINQLMNAGNTYIAAEAVYLAKKLGLDMDRFQKVIENSSGQSFVFANAVKKAIIPEHYEYGFKLELMKKDIGLAIEQAQSQDVVLPVSSLVYQIYQAIDHQGFGANHYGVVSKWVQQQNKNE